MPKKGISDISYSLYNLAIDLGVKFHFNSEIDSIIIKNKSAVGVSINKINHKDSYEEIDTRLASGWYVDSIDNWKKKKYKTEKVTFKISKKI